MGYNDGRSIGGLGGSSGGRCDRNLFQVLSVLLLCKVFAVAPLTKHSVAIMGWTLWDGSGRTPTGGAVATYELTRRLSRYLDCEMVFETSDRSKAGSVEDTGKGFGKRFVPRPKGLWRLKEGFLADYDLIHIWDAAPIFTYRAFTEKFLPHCYTLHSAASMSDWIRVASAFSVPDHDMIALGSRCLAQALNSFWRVPVDVIPYGVETDVFKPLDKDACREILHLPRDRLFLGFLGRPSKFDFVLAYETLREVRKLTGREDITLLVAGGSREIQPVQVKDDFLYLGYLEKSKVPQFLNSCDVFLNPVAGIREGFGLTVIEAMSCGLPIVTTSWNGYRETVSPSVGLLARTCWKDGDVWISERDLASACTELIKNESLREEMGRQARSRVEQNYRWDYCVEEYRRRFIELIRKGQPENIPYKEAAEKITITINGEPRTYSLKEAFMNRDKLSVDFQALHEGFVSGRRMKGVGWRRFMCTDNIVNLPKYRVNMKQSWDLLERQLSAHLPELAKALR